VGGSYDRDSGLGGGEGGGAIQEIDTRTRPERALAAAMRLISVKADAMSAAGPASPMALPAPGIQNSSVAVVGGLYKLSSVLYHGSKGNFSFNP
jgi:hypothetical protein